MREEGKDQPVASVLTAKTDVEEAERVTEETVIAVEGHVTDESNVCIENDNALFKVPAVKRRRGSRSGRASKAKRASAPSLQSESNEESGLLRVWGQMDVERSTSSVTVKWLLEEPIVYGARLDITTAATPGLSETLKAANLVTFGQLVNLAGSNLAEAGKLAERLGIRVP
ncbi:hypothetical protein SKAU_G00425520 [Synaphobranchus kaupii]|uniref:Uncharacterized protein n=1 Tax=Synaphobranchus kaupii TaxID=118154 RepID=A0A9Q1E543_SYNKA|nr:hypothetical protein SKAU_G00425520 [Synaphobranchus kaupii]